MFNLFFLVDAQEYKYVPFPDSNAVWSEVYWKPISESCPSWVFHKKALFNEDTLINNERYHKLFSSNEFSITKENSVCVGMLREDSLKKIWFRYNTEGIWPNTNEKGEYLLYDFNLSEGDKIGSEDYFQSQGVDFLVLDSIRFININNTLRKIYFFNIPWEIWIEGVGKIQGIIYPSGDLPTNGEDNDLVCMHQNDTLLFFNSGPDDIYDDCTPSFVLNGLAILPNPDIKVYPNPVVGEHVYFENLDFEVLELFDCNGCLINTINIKATSSFTLTVSNYSQGIYFYHLKTKGLLPTCGKLIID